MTHQKDGTRIPRRFLHRQQNPKISEAIKYNESGYFGLRRIKKEAEERAEAMPWR
jgi:hypothetical protein